MQRLEVSVAVRPIYGSLGVKRLTELVGVYKGETASFFANQTWRKLFNFTESPSMQIRCYQCRVPLIIYIYAYSCLQNRN
jgi:hypothetical protein